MPITNDAGASERLTRRAMVPRRIPAVLWWIGTAAVIVVLWQVAVDTGALSRRSFSTPGEVIRSFWEWHSSGDSLSHLSFTLRAVAAGYLLGVVLGAGVALVFFTQPIIGEIFDPFMAILNGVPKVIIAPPMVLLLGLGIVSKIAVAITLVFFLAFFNILGGLKSVDRSLINNLKVLGASGRDMVVDLYLPAIIAWVMSALRLGIGFAFAGVIVAEFMGSESGLGLTMKYAGERFQPSLLIAALVTLALVAAIVDRMLAVVEQRFSRWKVT
jgi:NitT/TauT family transport system permease protein